MRFDETIEKKPVCRNQKLWKRLIELTLHIYANHTHEDKKYLKD